MARRRNSIRPTKIKLSLPMDLAADIDLLLWNPVANKPTYGARSTLIATLLRQWLAAQRSGATITSVPSPTDIISSIEDDLDDTDIQSA